MTYTEKDYDAFVKDIETQYPAMFSQRYGGIAVGAGWWPIVKLLCANIQGHIDWMNERRALLQKENPHNLVIPEQVEQVVVSQIKEKFGGLRFYYDGGDTYIRGLVTMAEAWASIACEECGAPGRTRGDGWVKVLCDEHEAERTARRNIDIKYNPV